MLYIKFHKISVSNFLGKLQIHLVSSYVEPDKMQDESGFCKEENHFRGGQVEKQFACLNKVRGKEKIAI